MLILVGPSASGKTEAVKLLIKNYGMEKLVTYTSRPKRIAEIDGIDYNFISMEDFEKKIKEGFFLEYVLYNGNYYGTSYTSLAKNKVVILEPSGVKKYLEKVPELVKICYLKTPIEYRIKRMMARKDSEESMKQRIESDDLIFNDSLEKLVDWTINSTDISLEEMTEQIYTLYKDYL